MSPDDPRHGEYAGVQAHNKSGVPICGPCADARFRYHKRMKIRLRNGVRNRVPLGQEAWDIIDRYTRTQLHQATGINRNMLSRLHGSGPNKIVTRATRQRILDAAPAFTPLGIQRRLRALIAIGYSAAGLAKQLGYHREALQDIVMGSPEFVRHDYGLRIVALYAELEHTPAPNGATATRMRNRAARNGWHAPATWDDIDTDPEPQPNRRRSGWQPTHVVENYDFLIASGESREQALRQLGVTWDAVDRARRRAQKAEAA